MTSINSYNLLAVIIVLLVVILFAKEYQKKEQLRRYKRVCLGMSENEMLYIMGDGYNRSLLKNNRVKYEWRIDAKSFGTSYKGISNRTYTGVSKVTIYLKNGRVEEVRPYNVK